MASVPGSLKRHTAARRRAERRAERFSSEQGALYQNASLMTMEFAARPARVRLRSHAEAMSGALEKAPSERGLASEASLGEYSVRDGAAPDDQSSIRRPYFN